MDYKTSLQYKREFNKTKGRKVEINVTMKKVENEEVKQRVITYDRVSRVWIMQGK